MVRRSETYTFRLRPEARELIDAWADYWDTTGPRVLERLLAKATPPDKAGEAESRLRRAHQALISARNGTDTPT